MKNENTAALVAALRSGEYVQGTGHLVTRQDNGDPAYCCLGVGSVVAGVRRGYYDGESGQWVDDFGMFDGCRDLAPEPLIEWLGLSINDRDMEDGWTVYLDWPEHMSVRSGTTNGVSPAAASVDQLATLNDGGFTFDQIADLIEYFGVR